MHVLNIDHVNILGTPQLVDACRDFYVDVLGLNEGYRPPFTSRGVWLYAGSEAIVHLTETSDAPVNGDSAFDHFALRCVGLQGILERLRLRDIAHLVTRVPASGVTQVFIRDPAGVAVELSFSGEDSGEQGE